MFQATEHRPNFIQGYKTELILKTLNVIMFELTEIYFLLVGIKMLLLKLSRCYYQRNLSFCK